LMVFIPMLPGLIFTIQPIKTAAWMMLVPVLGQQALLMDIIRGESVPMAAYGMTAMSATLAALVCIQGTAALFRRERIIFGR
jgi:sodium transport system permease protein